MSGQSSWCVELAVKPGQFDNLIKLTGEMVAFASKEAGVLVYQRFISDDNKRMHACEWYADSDAALAHLGSFAPAIRSASRW